MTAATTPALHGDGTGSELTAVQMVMRSVAGHGWTATMVVLLAGAPAAKWFQMEQAPDADAWRQLAVVGTAAVVVIVRYGRSWWNAIVVRQIAWPRPPAPGDARSPVPVGMRGWLGDWRWARLLVGAGLVGTCAWSAIGIIDGAADTAIVAALVAALVVLVLFVAGEAHRAHTWAGRPAAAFTEAARSHSEGAPVVPAPVVPLPDRAVLWAVAPAVLVWCAILLVGWAVNGHFDPDVTGSIGSPDHAGTTFLAHGGAGRLLSTAAVVGFGEELLYRGLLFALALRTEFDRLAFLALSLSFAAWHLPDAWGDLGEVLVVVVVTFLAAHLVLYPLRLRSRTLAGPVLLHTATNASILLL